MKNLLKIAFTLPLVVLSFSLISCTPQAEDNTYEGTKLVVSEWPENVYSINLTSEDGSYGPTLTRKGNSIGSRLTGKVVLTIQYNRLDNAEYDDYFGYGIRFDSKNTFKVYINDVEAENENPAYVYTMRDGTEVEVNASLNKFVTSFDIADEKTIELTFENAPEKILNKDIRLYGDSQFQWAYIDVEDLKARFQSATVWGENSNGNTVELPRLGRNGLYVFDAYGQKFSVKLDVKDNYYSSVDDARITVSEGATVTVKDVNNQNMGSSFNCKVWLDSTRVADGTIIKLTGGKITPYDTSFFSGKSLTFVENYSNSLEVTSASLTLSGDAESGTSFVLTINETKWTGTWRIRVIDADNDGVADYAPSILLHSKWRSVPDARDILAGLEYWSKWTFNSFGYNDNYWFTMIEDTSTEN